jgi:hypothetical protein
MPTKSSPFLLYLSLNFGFNASLIPIPRKLNDITKNIIAKLGKRENHQADTKAPLL